MSLPVAGPGGWIEGERLVMSRSGGFPLGDSFPLNKRRTTVELLAVFGDMFATVSPSGLEKRSSLSSPMESVTVVISLAMVTISLTIVQGTGELAIALVKQYRAKTDD